MSNVEQTNQFDVLASPIDEGKSSEVRRRGGKDDIKEQAFQAREGIKSKAADLKEQVVASKDNLLGKVQSSLSSGIELAKQKAGYAADKPTDEIVEEVQEQAEEGWEAVKRKGKHQAKQAKEVVNQKVDENLTQEQKQKLKKGLKTAERGAKDAQLQAQSWSNNLIGQVFAGPQLRPVKNFIVRNNLQLPVVILGALLSLWAGLTIIRLITSAATPAKPEFDIHSKEATAEWLRYHAGDYKDRAVDMKDSLSARAATYLANHNWQKMQGKAIDYKDIGMRRLGLAEPTWGEWAWAKLTGRPVTWEDRVNSVLSLAQNGINRVDLKHLAGAGLLNKVKSAFATPEPTLADRASAAYDRVKSHLPGQAVPEPSYYESLKQNLADGVESIKAKIPGTEAAREAAEIAKAKAYAATHPSTLDKIKSGANYVKNRIVHGAEEIGHNVQDRSNEAADKAKLKMGL